MGKCLSSLRRREELRNEQTTPNTIPGPAPPFPAPPSPAPRSQAPPAPDQNENQIRVKALYHYAAQTPGDLSFNADELLYFEREESNGWWWCRNATNQSGYVPSNFVQRQDRGPESLPCWFDVDRLEAMRNLLMPGYGPGTYLLRPCRQQREVAKYTLSVRAEVADRSTGETRASVSHYMVKSMDDGGYYISPNNQFGSMEELIEHYSDPNTGLVVALSRACPKEWVPPAQFRDFEVDRSRIVTQEKLGNGAFGEVFKAELGRGQLVAVKTMTEGAMRREEFLSEGRAMHRLHHPKIVQLLGVCTIGDPIYIITEFMPNGDLKKYLTKDRETKKVTIDIMVGMLGQITEGMAYLEQMSFVHRDLRAANILVGHSNIVKVGDFGLSKFLDEDVYGVEVENNKFPIRWTSPEAMNNFEFSTKSDVWSFGVVIFEVITKGATPYGAMNNREVMHKVTKENYRMPNPRVLKSENDDNMYSLMTDCWKTNPADRPTFSWLKSTLQDFITSFEGQYQQQQ